MKVFKILLLTVVLCFCSLRYVPAQNEAPFDREKNIAWLENYLDVNADSTTAELYRLCKNGKYAVAALRAEIFRRQHPDKNRLYTAYIASCNYSLGHKARAYAIAMDFLKQQCDARTLSDQDVLMFAKSPSFYNIYSDTVLQQQMMNVYLDCSTGTAVPLPDVARSLIRLEYNDQAIRNLLSFQRAYAKSKAERELYFSQFMTKDSINGKALVQLYSTHTDLFEEKEVGETAYRSQFIQIWHVSNDSLMNNLFLPMYRRAMERKLIRPDNYVELLTHHITRNPKYQNDYVQIYDSLCKVYRCQNKVKYN